MTSRSDKDIDFRSEDIRRILMHLDTGACVSIVGVGSVGKSNLLRHILRDVVQQEHLGADTADTLKLVLVDPNNLLETPPSPLQPDRPSPWAGYEIMMHRLYKDFHPFHGFTEAEKESFKDRFDDLSDGNNPLWPYIGLRYLEIGLEMLLNPESLVRRKQRIVFVFDEFEEMLKQLPPKFFQSLRGLRDDYKYRLMFLTFTRRPIPQIIREDMNDSQALLSLEPFYELFTDTTHFLGPYNDADALKMLQDLSQRYDIDFRKIRRFVLHNTGGYAGLMRASFLLASRLPLTMGEPEAITQLIGNPAVRAECETIWKSLSEVERDMLQRMAHKRNQPVASPEDKDAIRLLLEKRLLQDQNGIEVMPPLFREYVMRYKA